ncbi:MAG: BlaI/MecI/CopY family transcriptional regulator [Candidatus Obscuribacterales bacterium]|nr:BlaI/MecI/CopY family transcriptional regulator [Candidatus Obscuribacterales bacterium]
MRLDDENASFRFNQDGLRKFMGDLEVDIMELVWKKANPTVTVRDIYELLRQRREIAYTTVMTTMVRLAEKGILRIVDKAGLANCYTPEQSRDEFIQGVVTKVLGIFFEQFPDESEYFLANKKPTRTSKKSASAKKR